MFLKQCFELRTTCLIKKYLLRDLANKNLRIQKYSGISRLVQNHPICCEVHKKSLIGSNVLHKEWYCKGLIDGDATQLLKDNELRNTSKLFPEARVTLNILGSRTPDKIFDVHFKQYTAGKKAVKNHEWTCIYKFVWPEKITFECTAISKRQAAEKAALQALHYLYTNKRIDQHGFPIYDNNVLQDIKSNLNEPLKAEFTENSLQRVERIWTDYESGIRGIYEKAAEKAKHFEMKVPTHLTKDSTVDEEDECLEESENPEDVVTERTEIRGPIHPVYGRIITPPTAQTLRKRKEALARKFQEYDETITELPIDAYAEQITSTLSTNRVCLIVGAAGCGKSSRVPPAILRHCDVCCDVIVSEPRRVAAIGLAERVAWEMGEEVGESVGFQVRLDSKPPRPPAGSILYCTSGVLLNRLHNNPGLLGCTHVIIDEAHERDVNTDVTLLLLKRSMDLNPDLKIIIMSATLDTEVFTEYFDSCPVIEVPGRTFPVQISYLDDIQEKYNIQLPSTVANSMKEDGRPQLNITEITEVIKAVDKHEKEGAILVFLPGWADIKYAKQILDECYKDSTLHLVIPVHARLSTMEQTRMFAKPSPGVRKIVLSTNVAETSVTIPDVLYVIDCGAANTNTQHTGTSCLETVWVSAAASKQRAGRAGRVQPGHCFRLYTKEKEQEFIPHSTPEILRVPLEQTVLDCKRYAPDEKALDFLSQLPEPPSDEAIQFAVDTLIDIGALNPKEKITRLGALISSLPLSVRASLYLLRATCCSCAVAAGNIAAHLDNAPELFTNADRREEIREIKREFSKTSDHAALHWIQHQYESQTRDARDKWCERHSLRKDRLEYVKSLSSLYLRELLKTGYIEPNLEMDDINRFSDIDELCVASLLSSVDSLLVTKRRVRTKGKLRTVTELYTTNGEKAHITSESVNYSLTKHSCPSVACHTGSRHSRERRALVTRHATRVTTHAPLLFSPGSVDQVQSEGDTVLSIRRHNLEIRVPESQAETILKAREMLWKTFNYYVDRDTKSLDYEELVNVSRFRIRLMKTIGRILVEAADGSKTSENVKDLG